ncbi:MAG TPA: hypothetical protein VHW09_27500 [Bryobacteraceae bacterium]|jgi:hypothetical protein|nr:hypothetical protein [Bryobacteraceae bacterium]
MNRTGEVPRRLALALVALAAAVAYAPGLTIPLLEDDYPNLLLSQQLGPPAQIGALFHDPIFRVRATSVWLLFWLWRVARLTPLLYRLTSLLLHIVNAWLVYGVCRAWPRMRAAAFWAALFFAVAEGHQEAVMWVSANNELLQFLFGAGALWCYLHDTNRKSRLAGASLFALALLSKESAVVFLPLFLLADRRRPWRLLPYIALAAVALASVAASRDVSFRFSDGSFSLHAPFWITWPANYLRILWIWGVVALAAILAARDRRLRGAALAAMVWIGIALAPYSFLTYSTRIPSRQTYLASAGLAMLVGLAAQWWQARAGSRRGVVAAVTAIVLVHNVGYLWTKKRHQFLERAAPTEQLISFARRTPGPIWVQCFPRNRFIAQEAVHLGAGHDPSDVIWDEAEAKRRGAAVFCYREGSK